jgi:hypothetical protein
MLLNLGSKSRADIRIHKTYEFLEDFYVRVYPKRALIWAGVVIVLILSNLCLLSMLVTSPLGR